MRSTAAILLFGAAAGCLMAAGVASLPFPEEISPRYYTATAAVIPLLLLAVFTRLGDRRTDLMTFVKDFLEIRRQSRDIALRLKKLLADMESEFQPSVETEGDAETELTQLIKKLKTQNAELLHDADDLSIALSMRRVMWVGVALHLLLTLLAGAGEAASLSQLATAGQSHVAFIVTNASIASMFLGVVYFEIFQWLSLGKLKQVLLQMDKSSHDL